MTGEASLARNYAWLTYAVLALIFWTLSWELWLAPLRPGGSWLALKAIPLVATLPGLQAQRTKTLQWLALLLPLYFAEAVMRTWSEHGRSAWCAGVALSLCLASYAAVLNHFRLRKRGD